jgi:hypothetical protein
MPLPTSHRFHRPFQPNIGPQDSRTGWTHSAGTRQHDNWQKFEMKRAGVNVLTQIMESLNIRFKIVKVVK